MRQTAALLAQIDNRKRTVGPLADTAELRREIVRLKQQLMQ